ncbi:MAG: hypothetical protein GY853_16595 [PVC group bacterium]|nr:hypothetical protein [PVC group bacterium]
MEDLDELLDLALIGGFECYECGLPMNPTNKICECGWSNPIKHLLQ